MATFHSQWITDDSVIFNQWDDIDPDVFTGTLGDDFIGFSTVVGGVRFHKFISAAQTEECFLQVPCDDCPPVVPCETNPPQDFYGRDYLSLNLKMIRGDTYQFSAAIILNSVPVDLTGCTIRMTAKWSVANPDLGAVFQISNASSAITVTSPTNGEIDVTIASGLTSPLPAKKVELPYDIQLVDTVGNIYTVLYGTLTVLPDVTITGS